MPYLRHIKRLQTAFPHLRYLAQFMEITTVPVRWWWIKPVQERVRKERASRIKIATVDYPPEGAPTSAPEVRVITEREVLASTLEDGPPPGVTRMYVVEDLSRDMTELLGSQLDIDPQFFRGHISDYFWYNTRDPWVELPDLDIVSRNRSYFNIAYAQPRYFRNNTQFQDAERQTALFNVLRRIDDDSGHKTFFDNEESIVGLVRNKASFWYRAVEDAENGKARREAVGEIVWESFLLSHIVTSNPVGRCPTRRSPRHGRLSPLGRLSTI
jgi:hypothetical protein